MMDVFGREELRDTFAKTGELKKFKKTYFYSKGDLKDLNTRLFWDKKSECNVQSPIYENKIAIISQYLLKQKGKILDIGFGCGQIEHNLSINSNLLLSGIDISHVAVSNLSRKVKGDFKISSIYKLQYKPLAFDFVLALDVLEHLPANKVLFAYKEIRKVLKNNGVFILSVPLNEDLKNLVKEGKNFNGHLRVYTPDIIKTELKINGFKIIEEHYLYAFKAFYRLKTLFVKYFPLDLRKPNLIIIIAQKHG